MVIKQIRQRFKNAANYGRRNKLGGVENISTIAATALTPYRRLKRSYLDRPPSKLKFKGKYKGVLISP